MKVWRHLIFPLLLANGAIVATLGMHAATVFNMWILAGCAIGLVGVCAMFLFAYIAGIR